MNKVFQIFAKVVLLSIVFFSGALAQHVPSNERGDDAIRTKQQMEGNQINTTIFNFGHTGRFEGTAPLSEQTPYEWPKNTGHVYLAHTSLIIGGEVVDRNGETQKIINFSAFRTSPEGKSWVLNPVPGYLNRSRDPIRIATDVDETTWPASWPDRMNDENDPGWPGTWNGYFGKGISQADQEIFYRCSDDYYDRYVNYFPDSTDLSRKGLGMLIDVRVLAWNQILVRDVMYMLHNIKNDGTEKINKVGVDLWYADFVGGNGDSQDDISEFNLAEDIAWSRDNDHRAPDFGSDPVGLVAVAFLETPGNSTDRIDNDGDGETFGPLVTEAMLVGEDPYNLIDDNGNGLIDESQAHIAFGVQTGVTYADGIDQNGDAEMGSPLVTQNMVDNSSSDVWKRWPPNPENDPIQGGQIHLIMVESDDIGFAFKDNIDNDGDGEENSPVVTQEMINQAANDAPYYRYKIPGKNIILYDVKQEDLGKMYADGIDNDNNGAIDEYMDEGIDEMIDESRDDGIDNDGDWLAIRDDVGLDGVPGTGDEGEGDGKPTSGARFGLPGEPNVDVTDVAETDQIGITTCQYIPAGTYNVSQTSDIVFWFDLMRPGRFYDPARIVAGEYDLFVTSSFFPLEPGQAEPISMAVIFANGPVPDPNGQYRQQELLRKKIRAQETYDNDYQFANAPLTPTLTAIPGDNKVTLYWDDIAESSFDRYIANIGGNGRDFEGYKIYRSSDPAFQDAENITSGFGNPTFKTPIATFDLVDGITGFDSVGVDGVKYYLGDDTGLKHSFVDNSVQNGFVYYYAVVSYDFGFPAGNILPSECSIRISRNPNGNLILGPNVAEVRPEAPAAGYIPPTLGTIELVEGTTTATIGYEILDENEILNNHVYYIMFEDTLKVASRPSDADTLTTKNFTLIDSTESRILVNKSTLLKSTDELPIVDGFRLVFNNESRVSLNEELSGWSNPNIPAFVFQKLSWGAVQGEARPNDYTITFGDVGFGRSTEKQIGTYTAPAKDVNFKVFNNSTGEYISFAIIEADLSSGDGVFSAKGALKDRIVFLEPDANGNLKFTWWFYLSVEPNTAEGFTIPQSGDSAIIKLKKPFLSSDIFRFVAEAGKIETEKAKDELDNIKVVPNPYVASARWEPKNTYRSGRGDRALHFTHLPSECTIRIFTINGELVDVIEHTSSFSDGTAVWDMLTKDNLSISYGIYIYHIDAPGIGEKIGKFAVIK